MTTYTLYGTLLPAILVITACSESARDSHTASPKSPLAVKTITVQVGDTPTLYTATGTVHARTESQLSSQIMARVLAVKVQAGDGVRAGQLLVSLDSQETDANYRKAEAGRAEAQNGIAVNDNSVAEAKASLDLANLTAQRMADLLAKRSISQQEMDEANAKQKTAEANYEMARARRAQLMNRIAQEDASLQQAEVTRGYSAIRAPFAGTVTARNVEPGAMAVPGNPLLTLEGSGNFRLHASVEESRVASVHVHDPVSVSIDSLPNEIAGRVIEISPVSDSNSHTYAVKIDLAPTSALHSGQFGRASFSASGKKALTVPSAAIVENGQLQSVFVSDQGIARLRLLTTGDRHNDHVEALSGLQPGDHIVYPIPAGLTDGDKVEERP